MVWAKKRKYQQQYRKQQQQQLGTIYFHHIKESDFKPNRYYTCTAENTKLKDYKFGNQFRLDVTKNRRRAFCALPKIVTGHFVVIGVWAMTWSSLAILGIRKERTLIRLKCYDKEK
ncbi:hypothetical protein LOAG_05937 [Loa loa]|uniref:Uncharacterized protein n=1 Tax=Loa loa TaxID=7209 RepID=A0A1S0TZF9_LOALO|nr:hypothetical protein LOAG_05937 [Loa loa]EFO22549.1 hypothetical protein LOAG_05937 [Loa loa]